MTSTPRYSIIKPGEMLNWPLYSPHRVDNHDCLNISLTTEYWTDPIRRNVMMNCANAVLRHKLGITPKKSRASTARASGQGRAAGGRQALRAAGQEQAPQCRPIDFRLDPAKPGAVINIGQHAA